jgi:VanZ family protein
MPLHRLALPLSPRARPVWRLVLALLLGTISYLALSPAPPPSMDMGWDKLNHLAAFGTLAFSAFYSLDSPKARWLYAPLALLGYGVLIELLQSQLPPRSADARDVLADALGIALGLAVAALARRLTRS